MNLREVGEGAWTGSIWPQDKDKWRALVIAVINLRVPYSAGNF